METLFDGAHAFGLARARIKIEGGDALGAETLLRDLAARYPDDERVWAMQGQLLAEQGRNEDALSSYREATRFAPADPAPHVALARLLHAINRDREALDECRLARAVAPNDPGTAALMREIEHGLAPR